MTSPRKQRPSKYYLVSYPDPAARTLRMKIRNDVMTAAEAGNTTEQGKICARYKHRLGLRIYIGWTRLHANMRIDPNQSPPPKKAASTKPEHYGCTCERDPECASCDQGWHKSCHYGCKYGRVVPRS